MTVPPPARDAGHGAVPLPDRSPPVTRAAPTVNRPLASGASSGHRSASIERRLPPSTRAQRGPQLRVAPLRLTARASTGRGEVGRRSPQGDAGPVGASPALKNVPPKEKAETSARLRAALDELRPRVGTLRLSVNRGTAEILVDAEAFGTYPQVSELYLSPGKHTVEARAGAESTKREVQAAVGATTPLSLDFKPEPVESGLVTPSSPASPSNPAKQADSANWLPTYVTLEASSLTTADSGNGGAGAAGQLAKATIGAGGGVISSINSCPGGNGGKGGDGGAGGGGAGGISVGIVWKGTMAPTVSVDTTITNGKAGLKGAGGAATNDGIAGVAQKILPLN